MPTAAGTGAIPSATPAVAAAGQGHAGYVVADALRDLGTRKTPDEVFAILNKIEPPLTWNTPAFRRSVERLEDHNRIRKYVSLALKTAESHMGAAGRRKTRAKRKHFRKRTSRRT